MWSKCYRILIDQDLGFIVITSNGKVYTNDMFDLIEELYSDEKFDPKFPTIYDFSGSSAIGYRVDILEFVDRLRKLRKGISVKKKIGIIVGSLNQKFLVNIFLKLSESLGLQVAMFDNTACCLVWITQDSFVREKISCMLVQNKKNFEMENRLNSVSLIEATQLPQIRFDTKQ